MATAASNRKSAFDLLASASDGEAVTPSDSAELTTQARALWVGAAGNIALVTTAGTSLTFVGIAAGTLLPIQCKQVKASSTTATSIVALW